MLSIKPLTGGGGDIYKYLSQGDYYSEGDRVTGEWFGKGAKALGLNGNVKLKDFENIRESNDPKTGEFLRVRHGKNNMYDLTFSAPKSVSIMARPGGDKRLEEAHKAAVAEALEQVERETVCKVQKGEDYQERKTGSLVAAVFTHDTSRELDPQIHSHAVVANMTFDGRENRWKAVHASAIFERKGYLQEVYRNALAREVVKLGYEIETRWNDRHTDQSFEIVGVDKSLCKKFSKMSKRIAQAVEEFKEKFRAVPSDREVGDLARSSEVRPQKMYEVTKEEVHARQVGQLDEKEKTQIEAVADQAKGREGAATESWDMAKSVKHAMDHVFERRSVERDFEIAREALIHGRGKMSVEGIERCFREMKKAGTILHHGKEIATEQTLNREKQMIWLVDQGMGKHERLDKGKDFIHSGKLNDKQRDAVDFVLGSRDFVVNLQGAAGTGKTWTLQEIYRGLKEAGQNVLAIAPTTGAKNEMERVGIEESKTLTVEKIVGDKLAVERMRGRVVMLDEAGMVSDRQMFELLRIGKQGNARFIFSGDSKQIQAVEAGDSLLNLEKESSLKTRSHELTKIERQKNKDYAFAIELIRDHPREGFDLLDAMGAIKEVPYFDRPAAVAAAVEGKKDALVVAATHDEIDRINQAVKLAPDENRETRQLTKMTPLNWTLVQKQDVRNFEPGQYLLFHGASKEAKIESAYRVTGTTKRLVHTLDLEGNEVAFSKKQARLFGVFQKKELEVSAGDKIVFSSNAKRPNFQCVNGDQAAVASFDEKGRAVLNDGRTMPLDFFQFDLGHAITAHKSQGKSSEEVIVSADAMRRELFYVAASRGKEGITIFTRNKEELREWVGISGERSSALELERQCIVAAGMDGFDPNGSNEYRQRKIRQRADERYRRSRDLNHTKEDERSGSYGYDGRVDLHRDGPEIGERERSGL